MLQVSGLRFAFDPARPAGARVEAGLVRVGDEYLQPHQRYKLVTKAYLASGRDGYDCLAAGRVLVDEECAPNLTSAVQNHFQASSVGMFNYPTHKCNTLLCAGNPDPVPAVLAAPPVAGDGEQEGERGAAAGLPAAAGGLGLPAGAQGGEQDSPAHTRGNRSLNQPDQPGS